jgi:multimeric flavodoxin WrbA
MKVLLVNGSPHEKGCTYTALTEIARTLEDEGIEAEIFFIGNKPISGCLDCGGCPKLGRCVIDDVVNEFTAKALDADGFVFGSPVHFAGAGGAITSFLDRTFFSAAGGGRRAFYLKPAACIVSARRAGTTAAFDQLIKYFTISEMPVISSQY